MKEWFKARTIWGAAIQTLSDAEAGRLAKAVWQYAMTGEQQDLSGAERGIFALIALTLGQDNEHDEKVSQKRAEAGAAGGRQKVANAMFAITDVAKVANATNKNKNKEKEKETLLTECKERRFTPPTVEEVEAYCNERNNGIDAQAFVDFYSSKGWKVGTTPMKDWRACIRTWERNRSTGPKKTVSAQQYEQRDYSSAQDEALRRMLQMGGDV